MKNRTGYGRQAETPIKTKQHKNRQPTTRNQLGTRHTTLFRDADGQCYKAVISDVNLTWVEVSTEEFLAANETLLKQ